MAKVFVWQEIAVTNVAEGKLDDPAVIDFISSALSAYTKSLSHD